MTPFPSLRYFWLASAPRIYFLVAFAASALMAIVLEFMSGGSSDFATTMILVIQMFAVSTGFATHASRGYFDPVLIATSRTRAAAFHFLTSALPGWVAWLVLAAAEVLRAGSFDVTALHASALIGLFLISAVAWAVTLPLPPFSGGGLWMLIAVGVVASGVFVAWLHPVARDPQWFAGNPGRAFLVGLSLPILMPAAPFPPLALAALAGIGLLALGAGILFVRNRDFSLAEEG